MIFFLSEESHEAEETGSASPKDEDFDTDLEIEGRSKYIGLSLFDIK